jgi:hypothetical protein
VLGERELENRKGEKMALGLGKMEKNTETPDEIRQN